MMRVMRSKQARTLIAASCMIAATSGCSEDRTAVGPDPSLGVGNVSLTAPSNVTAAASAAGQIDVAWKDNSSNEAGFEVHGSSDGPNGTFSLYSENGPDVTTATFSGMGPSLSFCYKVRAFTMTGKNKRTYSTFSATVCATTLPLPPKIPSGTAARAISSSTVHVSWVDNSSDEAGFRVERTPSSTCDGTWEIVAASAADVTSFADDGRTPEQWLCYRVSAFNASGSVSASSPPARTIPLAAPSPLVAGTVDHRSIELRWTDNSGFEENYEVHRATTAGGPYVLLVRLNSWVVSFVDDRVASSTTYWYQVRATRELGGSDFSNELAATTAPTPPPGPPSAPTNVDAWAYGSTLVTWTDGAWNETGFRVEWSLDSGSNWTLAASTPADAYGLWVDVGAVEQRNCYRVIAFNDLGDSPASNTDCVTLIAAPTDATVSADGVFRWKDHSNVEDGYEVHYCGPEECAAYIYGLPPNSESVLDPWYNPGFDYYIVAVKDGGYSHFAGVMRTENLIPSSVKKPISIRDFLARSVRAPRVKRSP
jgi:hypothetical protein